MRKAAAAADGLTKDGLKSPPAFGKKEWALAPFHVAQRPLDGNHVALDISPGKDTASFQLTQLPLQLEQA